MKYHRFLVSLILLDLPYYLDHHVSYWLYLSSFDFLLTLLIELLSSLRPSYIIFRLHWSSDLNWSGKKLCCTDAWFWLFATIHFVNFIILMLIIIINFDRYLFMCEDNILFVVVMEYLFFVVKKDLMTYNCVGWWLVLIILMITYIEIGAWDNRIAYPYKWASHAEIILCYMGDCWVCWPNGPSL